MEFKVKQGHISYPETLKRDLDQETRHGYEVVDVLDNKLQLEKSVKTYNFLIPQNSKELRDYYKQSGYGYVELSVRKKYIRAFGISFTKVERPTRNNANYLLVKSVHREPVKFYKEMLHAHHDEETKKISSAYNNLCNSLWNKSHYATESCETNWNYRILYIIRSNHCALDCCTL